MDFKNSPKPKKITPSPTLLADLARNAPGSPLARRLFDETAHGSVPPTMLAVPLDASDGSATSAVAAEVTPVTQVLSDDQRRQEDVYQQLTRQQLLMDKIATSQAATDEMLSTLHAAVAMLTSALRSGSAAVPDARHTAGVGANISNAADGNAAHQPISPALQQGTAAAAAEMNEHSAREEKSVSDPVSVPVSDAVRHAADTVDAATKRDAETPQTGSRQGTAADTAMRDVRDNELPDDGNANHHQDAQSTAQGTDAPSRISAAATGDSIEQAKMLDSPASSLQMLLQGA